MWVVIDSAYLSSIWKLLLPFGNFWNRMEPYLLETFGTFWKLLGPFGTSWNLLGNFIGSFTGAVQTHTHLGGNYLNSIPGGNKKDLVLLFKFTFDNKG